MIRRGGADQARLLRRIAAQLPLAAKAGDRAAVEILLRGLTEDQVADVVMIVAACAPGERLASLTAAPPPRPLKYGRDEPGMPRGNGLLELHACYEQLRRQGLKRREMPLAVQLGEREYDRRAKEARRRRAAA